MGERGTGSSPSRTSARRASPTSSRLGNGRTAGRSVTFYTRPWRDVDTLGYRLEAAPHGWDVIIDRAISVAYHGEPDERSTRKGYQESWLTPRESRVPLGLDGALLDGAAVVRHGYWDWERFADLLPTNYRPPE